MFGAPSVPYHSGIEKRSCSLTGLVWTTEKWGMRYVHQLETRGSGFIGRGRPFAAVWERAMTEIKRVLAREASKIEPDAEGLARTYTLARRRELFRRIGSAAAGLVVAAVGLTAIWIAFRGGPGVDPSTPAAPSESSPSPSPLPESHTRFVPETTREGDTVVLPVTFPDGTTAELRYPPSLDLAGLGIYPSTYGSAAGSCDGNILIRRYDAKGEIYAGDGPIAVFDSEDGTHAELWEGAKGWPGEFVVFQFGGWQVLIPCPAPTDRTPLDAEQWADVLRGHESENSFLVLGASPPITLTSAGDEYGPELYVAGGSDRFMVLTPGMACDTVVVERGPSLTKWCIEGDSGSVTVSAYGDDREFVDQAVDDLRVGTVKLAE